MPPRHCRHLLRRHHAGGQELAPGGWLPLVVAAGVGAAGGIAGQFGVEADARLGGDDHRHGAIGGLPQRRLGGCLAGASRREEHQPIQLALAHRLQRRKHARHRLASAGGRFHQRVLGIAEAAIDVLRHQPLLIAKGRERELERPQAAIPSGQPRLHAAEPGKVAAAGGLEVGDQVRRAPRFREHRLVRLRWMEIHQAQPQRRQAGGRLAAEHQQATVEPRLRHVLLAHLRVQRGGIRPCGLHLLDHAGRGIPTVDSATDGECAEGGGHAHFAAIALAAPSLPRLLAGDAFFGQGGALVAVVQIAAAMYEGCQFLHRYGVLGAHACTRQGRTRATCTGSPWASRASIHSRWWI